MITPDISPAFAIIPLLLIQLLLTVTIDGLVLYRFGYHRLLACLTYSTLVNLISLVSGVLLLLQVSAMLVVDEEVSWKSIALLYSVAALVEYFILRLCNRSFPASRLVLPVLLMNVLSLIPLYFLLLS